LYLYPNANSYFLASDEELRNTLVHYIYKYRTLRTYNETYNCHYFVDQLLNRLEIYKKWTRNGIRPIRNFIENIPKMETPGDSFTLSFYKITKVIHNHQELKEFWNAIQDSLKFDIDNDPKIAMEIIDLIRGLERGMIARDEELSDGPIDFRDHYDNDGTLKYGNGISYAYNVEKYTEQMDL